MVSAAPAGDVESWNHVGGQILRIGHFNWSVSAEGRVRDRFGSLYDRRLGTVIGVDLGHRFTASGGYLVQNKEHSENRFLWEQRLTAGLGYELFRHGSVRVEGLTLYERHFTPSGYADSNRYRQRFEMESRKKGLSPWLYEDFTFLNEGFVRSRSRAGLLWRSRGYYFAVGYQFETIRNPPGSSWHPRHAIIISFSGLRFHILD